MHNFYLYSKIYDMSGYLHPNFRIGIGMRILLSKDMLKINPISSCAVIKYKLNNTASVTASI